jgi:Domain of unknown function (DUF6378)
MYLLRSAVFGSAIADDCRRTDRITVRFNRQSRTSPADPSSSRGSDQLLEEAAGVVRDRRRAYGEPAVLFQSVAVRWSQILAIPITPSQVILCLIDIKVARLARAGGPADIARLFSIRRPLVSSKLLRLPVVTTSLLPVLASGLEALDAIVDAVHRRAAAAGHQQCTRSGGQRALHKRSDRFAILPRPSLRLRGSASSRRRRPGSHRGR